MRFDTLLTAAAFMALPLSTFCPRARATDDGSTRPTVMIPTTLPSPSDCAWLIANISADNRFYIMSSDNSGVIINTGSIDRIVRCGLEAVPTLLQRMGDKACDFDTFVRCYSAAFQILRDRDKDANVYWTGGCSVEDRDGAFVFQPGMQQDDDIFRQKVRASILQNYTATIGVVGATSRPSSTTPSDGR